MSGFRKKPNVDDFVKGATIDGTNGINTPPREEKKLAKKAIKPKALSKAILFKTTSELHKKIKVYSAVNEISVNQVVELAIQQFFKEKNI